LGYTVVGGVAGETTEPPLLARDAPVTVAWLDETMSEIRFGMRFVLASLGTWRVTHLLTREDGPGDSVFRMRVRAGSGPIGELMDCFFCLSFWVAAPFAMIVAPRRREVPLTWIALSGAACLLELLVPDSPGGPHAREEEVAHELLRPEAAGA
jgi:hypothetical protein